MVTSWACWDACGVTMHCVPNTVAATWLRGTAPCLAHTALLLPGAKKVTNKATLWYVPLSLKNVNKVVEVPPIQVGFLVAPGSVGARMADGGLCPCHQGVQRRVPFTAVRAQGAGG